eukprot:2720546-Rhodomonas_salina.1
MAKEERRDPECNEKRRKKSRCSAATVVARQCGAHEERSVPVWHAKEILAALKRARIQAKFALTACACQSGQNHRSDQVEGLCNPREVSEETVKRSV